MAKSLYGFERSKERRFFQSESIQNRITIQACILEVITPYKALNEIESTRYVEIKELLDSDLTVNSGVHFVIVTEDDEYGVVKSPYSEDALRSIYGSDDSIKGRLLLFDALERTSISYESVDNVRFKGSEKEAVTDIDLLLPVSTAGIFSKRVSGTVKSRRFKGQ